MTLKNPRLAFWTLIALGAAILYAAFGLFATVVHAQGADPVTTAQTSTATMADLVVAHGMIWGPILFAFGLLSWVLVKNSSTHWIAQGRKLALLTGGSLVLEAVLRWQLAGGTLEAVLSAVVMAALLVRNPFQQAPAAAPAPAPVPTTNPEGVL
jgi:hypothetical protein